MNENVVNLDDHRIRLKYDRKISIAVGQRCDSKVWKNREVYWSELVKKLESPTVTPESMAEYGAFNKAQKDNAKDIGGFVGGSLKGGRRKIERVGVRSILTLDADYPSESFLDDIRMTSDFAWCIYSTHSHRPDHQRYRLLIPLDRDITPDEYGAVSRKVAEQIGIEEFDDTTYETNRLMYWPSHPSDAPYAFEYTDAPFLNADSVLALYEDWRDESFWPESERTAKKRSHKIGEKQSDPLLKKGIVGAFCRAYYPIQEAIETHLSEVYAPTGKEDRWTYIPGSPKVP